MGKIKMAIMFLLGVLLASFAGCGGSIEPLKIGIDTGENSQFLKVAKHQGFLNERFQIIEFSSRGDNVESFYIGRTDVAYSSLFDSVYFAGKGELGKIFLVTGYLDKTRALVVEKGTESLVGKKIAMEADTDEYLELVEFLNERNYSEEDFTIEFTTQEEAEDEFVAGEVDALYFYKPFDEKVYEKGEIYKESESVEKLNEVLIVNDRVIKTHKKDLEKIVDVWYKVLHIKLTDPEKYNSILDEIGYEIKEHYEYKYYLTDDNEKFLVDGEIEEMLIEESEEIEEYIDMKGEVKTLYTGEIIK